MVYIFVVYIWPTSFLGEEKSDGKEKTDWEWWPILPEKENGGKVDEKEKGQRLCLCQGCTVSEEKYRWLNQCCVVASGC